jgi:hypothetical protein
MKKSKVINTYVDDEMYKVLKGLSFCENRSLS